jgi:hypothetical protein
MPDGILAPSSPRAPPRIYISHRNMPLTHLRALPLAPADHGRPRVTSLAHPHPVGGEGAAWAARVSGGDGGYRLAKPREVHGNRRPAGPGSNQEHCGSARMVGGCLTKERGSRM